MGTVTFSALQRVSTGGKNRACIATLTMSNNYSTGGDSLNAEYQLPFSDVENIDFFELDSDSSHFFQFDDTTKTVLCYQTNSSGIGNTGNTSAGTPAGNINAQNFSGNALAGHNHTFSGNALAGHSHTFSGNAMGNHSHLLTWQEDAAIPVVANVGTIVIQKSILNAVYATVGGITGPITIIPNSIALASGQCHFDSPGNTITFFAGDAITECKITGLYIGAQSASAGVPAGSIDSVSAGTPSGTISTDSAGTPSGTVDQAVFSGNAMGTHNHTYLAGGALTEVANGTDISTVSVRCKVWGRM